MKEIVILSGKGGTGKTSITAALAILAGNDAVIADCDVDAANMHLLLNPDFDQRLDFFCGELADINKELCSICGKCAEICRFNAITFSDNQYKISSIDCDGCGYCAKVCPTQAIIMHSRKSGSVFTSKTKIGSTMVHAKLDVGAENSGKLVAKVKNDAKFIAVRDNKRYILVDGSPGIGCPVVSSLAGANYVILITEPTRSGLNDLRRVFAVIKNFRIRAGCLINKCDLNEVVASEIKTFLKEMGIDHLADIPYDNNFTRLMIEGKTIAEIQSPIKQIIEDVWNRVKQI